MKLLLGGLVLISLLFAQAALADVACFTTVPEGPVAVGDAVRLGGGGFDPGTRIAIFVGASNVAGGTADASGAVTATYVFDAPGEYPVQAFGFVDGEPCALGYSALLVEGDGVSVSVATVPDGFVPPLLTTTTTLVIGRLGYLDGRSFAVETDDAAPTATVAAAATDAPSVTSATAVTASGDGVSVLLLGALTALGAAALGSGAGWVLRRRRS